MNLEFYKGKKVFLTGHTGFKGAWLCQMLTGAGAEVTGYSLDPPTEPNLFNRAGLTGKIRDVRGDVRDYALMQKTIDEAQPDIVFHLAAQTIVKEGYRSPRETFETNIMGTVNLLECVRRGKSVKSVLNVTTDKVYRNNEWEWGYRETDVLDGHDPYSNSKSCSELVTAGYQRSFFAEADTAISTARAGNVIGGGDFAADRIIPDCIRAVSRGNRIRIRNPHAVRPFQHVLEPLSAYLMIAEKQYENPFLAGNYNVGPEDCDCVTTGRLAELFCSCWGDGAAWYHEAEEHAPHEANFLKLDCSHIRRVIGWKPKWHIEEAIRQTCTFAKQWNAQAEISEEMDREIACYFGE